MTTGTVERMRDSDVFLMGLRSCQGVGEKQLQIVCLPLNPSEEENLF